jgi:hypothetical protein
MSPDAAPESIWRELPHELIFHVTAMNALHPIGHVHVTPQLFRLCRVLFGSMASLSEIANPKPKRNVPRQISLWAVP